MIRTRKVALALAFVASIVAGGTSVAAAQQSTKQSRAVAPAPTAPQAPVMRAQMPGYRHGGMYARGRYGYGRRYYGMQRGRWYGHGMARYSRYGGRYGHPHGHRGMNRYGRRGGMRGRRMNGARARHYHGVI